MQTINKNQINWTVACMNEYARHNSMYVKSAFQYLLQHGGIDFLKEHYEAEHLLSIDDTVEDLSHLCRRS